MNFSMLKHIILAYALQIIRKYNSIPVGTFFFWSGGLFSNYNLYSLVHNYIKMHVLIKNIMMHVM